MDFQVEGETKPLLAKYYPRQVNFSPVGLHLQFNLVFSEVTLSKMTACSGESRISQMGGGGAPTSEFGAKTYDGTSREQFLVPLPPYNPVFTIVIYGW